MRVLTGKFKAVVKIQSNAKNSIFQNKIVTITIIIDCRAWARSSVLIFFL